MAGDDTEGVLLLTNDGKLNHYLLSPRSHVIKTYYVETDSAIPADTVRLFREGVDLGDFVTKPAELEILEEKKARLSISEGKFHQVKRMFEKAGCRVVFLRRIRFADLTPDGLSAGESRPLSQEEICALKKDQPSD